MKVRVTMHDDCAADLREWLARLPGAPQDRYLLLAVSVEELKRELARTRGHPVRSEFRDDPPPPSHWWPFASECVVRYVIRDSSFFVTARHVEVIQIVRAFPL